MQPRICWTSANSVVSNSPLFDLGGLASNNGLSEDQERWLLEAYFEITERGPHRGHTLEVRISNEPAIELYRSFGFVATGVRKCYYSDNREDALIMWKDWEGATA